MSNNIEISSNPEVKKIFELTLIDFLNYIKKCDESQLMSILKEKEIVLNAPIEFFNTLLLNSPISIKKQIFKDKQFLTKALQIPKNRFGKTFFELLTEEEKIEFLKNKTLLDAIDQTIFFKYVKKLTIKQTEKLNSILSVIIDNNDYQKILPSLFKKMKIEQDLQNNIRNKLNNKTRNILGYLNSTNKYELFIYNKFNINIKVNKYDGDKNMLCFNDCHIISKDYLDKINEKHMNLIIQKIIENNYEVKEKDYTKIFITALKLYEIFGFDNALKVLNNKFTYMNVSTLKRYAQLDYIDQRRQYRLENQEKFYSYEMLQNAKKALQEKDLYFFCNVCCNLSDDYLMNFFEKIKSELRKSKETEEDEIITNILQHELKEREEHLKNEYIETYCNKFSNYKKLYRSPLTYEELYKIFKNVSTEVKLNEKGHVIVNEQLKKFLLGNENQDNDCLFRLILNKKAFGLNQNLDTLINSFEDIRKIATKKTNNFSLYSILDIIDICKSTLYKLAPNEQDMTLETITKIQNATQYCSEPKEDILLRAKKLHVERKAKTYSTIPTVSGTTKKQITYKILPFDYESLITCGIDTGNCLRVGGLGEDFLRYCMTNPHAVIIGLWDENNKFYICPYIRNGNGIYGNGIDPKPETDDLKQALMEALQECTAKIIKTSSQKEKIEFATVTDLNYKDFFAKREIKKIEVDRYLPLEEKFYSDYHKDEIKNYIISSTKGLQGTRYYTPKERYYQARIPNYVYNINTEKDKERIELLINSIKYSSIDFKTKLTFGEKNAEKRRFRKLKLEEFEYIIGNKDWFIAIDNCLNIISCRLPYDPRSSQEYMDAFISLKAKYNIDIEGKVL